MFASIQNRIIWLSIFTAINLSILGCVNPEDINWENTPITGTVLGTVDFSDEYGPRNKIRIKLDSGKLILLDPPSKKFIVKGQEVKLRQGSTDSGRKFYSW